MLVLGRKVEEKISINNGQIVVTVVAVRGEMVRLGFEADPSIPIHRMEVQAAVDRERRNGRGLNPE